MKHCGTQELETGRLLLRRLTMDDSEMMFNNWASDPEVTRYLRWNAHRSWAETAEMLNEWEKHYGDPTFYQWGVENKRSGVLMGKQYAVANDIDASTAAAWNGGKGFDPIGGSAAVWTTCQLFFQVLLLAGYAWTHGLVARLSPARQRVVQLTLMGVALVALLATTAWWSKP